MLHNTNRRVKEYGRRHRFQSRWWRVLAAMACVVVFCTTYALILPAATLSQDTVCGLEEHTHSDECYAQELICTDESEEHEHSDACYVSVLTCDLEEHQHSDDCYADDEGVSEQSEEAATEAAGESATEAGTADAETGKGSEGSGEGLTEDAEVDGSKDSAKGTENSGEGLTENAEIDGTENAAEGLTEDGVVDGEDAEDTEEFTLTEQTVEATVYTDDGYDDLYTENVTITVAGNLPEGVKVKAYPVNVTLDDETTVVEAYDITLFVPVEDEETGEVEEKTYEPKDAVEVQIASDNLKDLESVEIYHIPDGEDAQPEAVQSDLKDGEVKFSADSFSIYVVGSKDGISLASISGDTTVAVGKTITLYCNSGGYGTSTWSSSDTSIATVTYSGSTCYVTGVKDGTVTITHTRKRSGGGYGPGGGNNTHSDTYTVTVGTPREDDEQAQIYALKTPTSTPRSNDTNQWTSYHGWNATVNMTGATWVDTVGDVVGKNVVDSPSSYIMSWPNNATGGSWTLTRDDAITGDAFSTLLDEIWDAYKSEIQKDLGITDLQKSDVTSITLTPYKISRSNGTTPDKHVDCTISVKSSKVYTAKFNVKEVGSTGYENVYSKNYKITDPVDAYTYNDGSKSYAIGDTKVVDGKTYRLTGWYTENNDGGARSDTIASFNYKPSDKELSDGAVNFYAEWVEVTNDLTIVKYEKGSEGTLLSGAVFELMQNDTVVKTSDATGTNGKVTITGISDGTFTVEENTAPTGYNKLDGTISIKFNNGSLTMEGTTLDGVKVENGKLYVPNEPNKIQVKKYDGGDNSVLQGATFKLTGPDGFEEQTGTTGTDGLVDFTKLPDGTYELEETGTPAGYNSLGAKIKFSVTNGVVNQVETNDIGAKAEDGIVTVPNYKLATINVKKVDSKNSSVTLAGAEFTLQNSDSKYYNLIDGTVTWEDNAVPFKTSDEGTVSFTNIPDGTYTLKESKAPANYTGISGSITVTVENGSVTYDVGSTSATTSDNTVTVPNDQILVSFQLKKVDSADGSKVLSGADFTLNDSNGSKVQEGTTNTNGLIKFTNLQAGIYTLTETKAPDGYNILTETIKITVENGAVKSEGNSVSQDTDGTYIVTVKNTAGTALPNTGGPGTTMYTLSGLMLMAIAAAGCLMYRGRMSGKGGAR